jgi:hypothetical protein
MATVIRVAESAPLPTEWSQMTASPTQLPHRVVTHDRFPDLFPHRVVTLVASLAQEAANCDHSIGT